VKLPLSCIVTATRNSQQSTTTVVHAALACNYRYSVGQFIIIAVLCGDAVRTGQSVLAAGLDLLQPTVTPLGADNIVSNIELTAAWETSGAAITHRDHSVPVCYVAQ
jgi:hypothetical protein